MVYSNVNGMVSKLEKITDVIQEEKPDIIPYRNKAFDSFTFKTAMEIIIKWMEAFLAEKTMRTVVRGYSPWMVVTSSA